MELNWTTVVLEIVNFLILVWILKHFLYRPVLHVIEQRRAGIEATLAQAQARAEQAEKLQAQYENRLTEWQHDRQVAREVLQRELQQQRATALAELEQSLGAEREKARVVEERQLHEREERRERAALQLAARFAARLLQDLSGPELDDRILMLACAQLAQLPEAQRSALRRAVAQGAAEVQVTSARAFSEVQRQRLTAALQDLLGDAVGCTFSEDAALIAGLRLTLGDWSLNADLHDELKSFSDQAHGTD